jgi:ankyrin repeat protein
MAELLLDFGADIDWIIDKKRGYTLLMYLCANKVELTPKEQLIHYQIIKFLIENGANRNIKTSKGKTAIDLCSKHPMAE